MNVTPLALPEVLRIEPRVLRDARGRFLESWHAERYSAAGLPAGFVQDNVSVSHRGVLRGLHLQHPHAQGKLVGVVHGAMYDVAVDVRVGSPTFGRWVGETLTPETGWQLWIPGGFAHGFVALADDTVVTYKATAAYDASSELAIAWDDPAIGIDWPLDGSPLLSARDAAAPRLRDVAPDRLPPYAAATMREVVA